MTNESPYIDPTRIIRSTPDIDPCPDTLRSTELPPHQDELVLPVLPREVAHAHTPAEWRALERRIADRLSHARAILSAHGREPIVRGIIASPDIPGWYVSDAPHCEPDADDRATHAWYWVSG